MVARRIHPTVWETVKTQAKAAHRRIEGRLDKVEWDGLMCRLIGHTTPWEQMNYNVRTKRREPVFVCRRCKQVFGGVRL